MADTSPTPVVDESGVEELAGRRSASGGFDIATPVGIFAVAFLLYALLPTRNFNYADDSLRWAYELTQKRSGLINGHHLYLNPMRQFYQWLDDIGVHVSPVSLLAIYSAFWGALGLAFLHLLLQRAGFRGLALWACVACGLSAGYWSYSIVGDVYAPSIALLVIGLFFTYQAVCAPGERFPWRDTIAAVVAFALMLVHHQALFFFVIGLGVGLLILRFGSFRRRLQLAFMIPGLVGAVAVIVYGFAYQYAKASGLKIGFIRFCAGYVDAFDARPDQKRFGIGSLLQFAMGETRALVSTNVLFGEEHVALAVQSRYPTRAVYPYPYLVAGLPQWVAVAIGILAIMAVLVAMWLIARGVWAGMRERELVTLIVVAAVPQLLFFVWWEGISDEFCLWTLPLLIILAVRGAAATERSKQHLAVLSALIGISTLVGSTSLFWNAKNDIDYVNDGFATTLTSSDFLVGFEDIQSDSRIKLLAHRNGFDYVNIRLFAPRWTDADEAKLESAISGALAKGAKIHVSPRLTHPPKSAITFMRNLNKNFDQRRGAIIERLRRIPETEWPELKVFLDDYFYSDGASPRPR
jgi:hypothetical protein